MRLLPDRLIEVEYLIRMVIAILLGFAIGTERKLRFKEAGMRTHTIVSAGACLFMLISKYGFYDMIDTINGKYDGARLAAQVVSGIGFIGAGMIMYRKQVIHGLTTAAGVWITAGVGMAAGAGMYILAASSSALLILAQCIMHIDCKFFKNKRYMSLWVVFNSNGEESDVIRQLFGVDSYSHLEAKKQDGNTVFSVLIRTDKMFDDKFILSALQQYPFIQSINRVDDEV